MLPTIRIQTGGEEGGHERESVCVSGWVGGGGVQIRGKMRAPCVYKINVFSVTLQRITFKNKRF